MIGLLVVVIVVLYVMLYQYVVSKVYEKTKSIKKKNIAIAIMILIPTWDIILGFPIYAYLCALESGTKIYKTVDNVEGFYIGERGIQREPHEPYEGYKYIEYKEMDYSRPTGKYYRSYWVDYYKDRNATELCVYPRYPKNLDDPYTKAVNNGRCIVKEEIAENEISRWEYHYGSREKTEIFPLGIKLIELAFVKDRAKQKQIAEVQYIWWRAGFIAGYFLTGWGASLTPSGFECRYTNELDFLTKTLKQKKDINNGND